jgi:hypothetical protein
MKTQQTQLKSDNQRLARFPMRVVVPLSLLALGAFAGGLPEPGLTMYGVVRNAAAGNAPLTSGALTWTITPPNGSPVKVTALLTDLGRQYSYVLRVPFETIVGSATLSPNTLQLNSAITSYMRTNVVFNAGTVTYPARLSSGSLGYFNFSTADRGKMEQVDLTVNAPSLGQPPRFTGSGGFSNGQFQMLMSGTAGQSYTLLTSTNLTSWTPLEVFLCSNSVMTIADPSATNFNRRFYRLGQ